MEVKTKHDIGDVRWLMLGSKPVEDNIEFIKLTIGGIPNIQISYNFKSYKGQSFAENSIFKTKEELKNHIFNEQGSTNQ